MEWADGFSKGHFATSGTRAKISFLNLYEREKDICISVLWGMCECVCM